MSKKILLVEDEADQLRAMLAILQKMDLHRNALTAPSGQVGKYLIKEFSPDIIISDWVMPEVSGLDLVLYNNQELGRKNIPILLITGKRVTYEDMKVAFKAGATDYLRKPYSEQEFISRVKALVDASDFHQKIDQLSNKINEST